MHPDLFTVAKKDYAQIEKQLSAIVFAWERFNQFIYGKQVTVESVHKPLQAIIAKPLYAPTRIQRATYHPVAYPPDLSYSASQFQLNLSFWRENV